MAPTRSSLAALALLVAASALGAPAAAAAAQQATCAGRIQATVSSCHGDIKAIIAGAGASVTPSPACCAAAAGIFSGKFMAECGCDAGVVAIKATTSDASVDEMRAVTGAKCGVVEPAAFPACAAAAARVAWPLRKTLGYNGTAPYTRSGSACYETKCSKTKVCPVDKQNKPVASYATKLADAQHNRFLGSCDLAAGNPPGIDERMIPKNNGTTMCSLPNLNHTGIQFDSDGCFVTCKPIGYLIASGPTFRAFPKHEMCTAPSAQGGTVGFVPYTRNCSPCYKTKCSKRKVCPFDKHNQTVKDYASKLAMAQNDTTLGICDTSFGLLADGDTRLTARNKGTTFCSSAENYTGIVFDADGCFVTCKPIGYVIESDDANRATFHPEYEMCKLEPPKGGDNPLSSAFYDEQCRPTACFPGTATAVLANDTVKALRDLRVGDVIAAVKPDGAVTFAPIVFFDHQVDGRKATFIRLSLTDGSALELSAGHFIPVGDKLESAVFKRASAVQVGNTVLVAPKGAAAAEPALVDAVEYVTRSGLFAPVTSEGTVIVDGVVASSYSDTPLDVLYDALGWTDSLHRANHAMHAPLRVLYRVFGPKLLAKLTPILAGLVGLDTAQIAAVFSAQAASV